MNIDNPNNPIIPLLRIDLEHTRESILYSLAQHSNEINAIINEAVTKFCTYDNIVSIVTESIRKEIPLALQEAIHNHFTRGVGYAQIREFVEHMMIAIAKPEQEKKI